MGNIVVMKLFSGEEVIAKENDEGLFEKPRVIQMMQTSQGVGAGLVPYIVSSPDATVDFNMSAVVVIIDAPAQIETAYLQQTSGLDLTGRL